MKILLAEDDKEVQVVIKEILENLGHQVEACDDGKHALLAFDGHEVIITDHDMPNMNGYELVEGIRQTDGFVPIFVYSGRDFAYLTHIYSKTDVQGIVDKTAVNKLLSLVGGQ